MALDTNNDLLTPTNLGAFVPSNATNGSNFFVVARDSVSSIDDVNDFYTFNLAKTSSLSISLSGLSSTTSVDLIRNIDNSRFGDPGETIKTMSISEFNGIRNVAGLGAGNYALRVAKVGAGTSPYEINLSANVGSGVHQDALDNRGGTELDILNGPRSMIGSLNADLGDRDDLYRFRVDVPTQVDLSFVGSGGAPISTLMRTPDNSNPLVHGELLSFTPTLTSQRFDTLLPGEYLLSGISSGNNYTLNVNAKPIKQAQLSVSVGRVSTNVNFGFFDPPDFFVKATIDGVRDKTRTVDDKKTVDFNETITQTVNPNKQIIPITLEVIDSDGGLRFDGDEGDINAIRGIRSLSMEYDVLTRTIVRLNNSTSIFDFKREGETVTVTGNGDDGRATTLSFSINYNTFGFGQTSFSNSTPINVGTNANQRLTGLPELSGIFDGRGGRDRISTLDGDDIAVGGTGNDFIDAGTGDDILFGGLDRDTLIGGEGSDTFVFVAGTGADVIRDFRNGIDQIGLTNGISFGMLEIVQRGRHTAIGLGDEKLAVLKGMRASQIGAEDFVAVNFTSFKGMEVPVIVA